MGTVGPTGITLLAAQPAHRSKSRAVRDPFVVGPLLNIATWEGRPVSFSPFSGTILATTGFSHGRLSQIVVDTLLIVITTNYSGGTTSTADAGTDIIGDTRTGADATPVAARDSTTIIGTLRTGLGTSNVRRGVVSTIPASVSSVC